MEHLNNHIYIYTDGGIRGQNGKGDKNTIGSHAYILLLNGREFCHSESQRDSTSNREEMLAILHGLQKLNRKDLPVIVTSDSKYCVEGLNSWVKKWKNNNWKSSENFPVKNKDLWVQLDEIISEFDNVKIEWCKGHAGNEYNERCDKMCQESIIEFQQKQQNLKQNMINGLCKSIDMDEDLW